MKIKKNKLIKLKRKKKQYYYNVERQKHDPFTIMYLKIHDILFKINQVKTNSAAVIPDIK